jgi:hypothetical protein
LERPRNPEIPLDQRDLPTGAQALDDVSRRNETETIRGDTGKIRGICSAFVPAIVGLSVPAAFALAIIVLAIAFPRHHSHRSSAGFAWGGRVMRDDREKDTPSDSAAAYALLIVIGALIGILAFAWILWLGVHLLF